MKLLDFLVKEATVENLTGSDKESVVKEMVSALVKVKVLKESAVKDVVQKILEREKQGSTGIGNWLAVPHLKHTRHVDRIVGVFGRSRAGVDFGAIDGSHCHIFFLLFTPKKEATNHLEALKKVAQLARDADFCRYLRDAKDLKEILELLEEADAR
jgi:mannitol/fructose-specific phosphotransferase system IIA component (Ntr-type)